MRSSARSAAKYKELHILATNTEEIFLLGIISTNKKKKKYVLMIILERKNIKSSLIDTNLLKIWINFKCMNTYVTTTSYVFSCTSE